MTIRHVWRRGITTRLPPLAGNRPLLAIVVARKPTARHYTIINIILDVVVVVLSELYRRRRRRRTKGRRGTNWCWSFRQTPSIYPYLCDAFLSSQRYSSPLQSHTPVCIGGRNSNRLINSNLLKSSETLYLSPSLAESPSWWDTYTRIKPNWGVSHYIPLHESVTWLWTPLFIYVCIACIPSSAINQLNQSGPFGFPNTNSVPFKHLIRRAPAISIIIHHHNRATPR